MIRNNGFARKFLLVSLCVFIGLITMTGLAGAAPAGYNHSAQVNLTIGADITDYPIKLILYNTTGTDSGPVLHLGTGVNLSIPDVRFNQTHNQSDTSENLSFWVEHTNTTSTSITVWVKVARIYSNTTSGIMVYYENSGATAASNGTSTFYRFEDWNGDFTGWTKSGTPTISDGILNCSSGGSVSVTDNTTHGTGYAMRGYVRSTIISSGYVIYFCSFGTSNYRSGASFSSATNASQHLSASGGVFTYTNMTGAAANTWMVYEVGRNGTTSVVCSVDDKNQTEINTNIYNGNNKIMFNAGNTAPARIENDWVLIRKFVYPEPAVDGESPSTPVTRPVVALNTSTKTITEGGSLVLNVSLNTSFDTTTKVYYTVKGFTAYDEVNYNWHSITANGSIGLYGDSLWRAAGATFGNNLTVALGGGWSVDNCGVNAYETADYLANWGNSSLYYCTNNTMMGRAGWPTIAMVQIGTNDIGSSTTVETTETNLLTIYDWLETNGTLPMLCTIPPCAWWSAAQQTKCDQINAWILSTAATRHYPVFDMDSILTDPEDSNQKLPAYTDDETHPNAAGYDAMIDAINPDNFTCTYLTFAPEETSKTLTIDTLFTADTDEGKYFYVNLSANTDYILDDIYTCDVTLKEGLTLQFNITGYTVSEDAGTVLINLTKAGTGAASVNLTCVDGSAVDGTNYTKIEQEYVFTDEETNKWINITILDDSNPYGNSQFFVNLTSTNASFGSKRNATITIIEDDTPAPTPIPAPTAAPTPTPTGNVSSSFSNIQTAINEITTIVTGLPNFVLSLVPYVLNMAFMAAFFGALILLVGMVKS